MSDKHTKETWTAVMHLIWGKRLTLICDKSTAFFQDEDDAIRAAACCRACVGIPTDALEDDEIGKMAEALEDSTAQLRSAQALLSRAGRNVDSDDCMREADYNEAILSKLKGE